MLTGALLLPKEYELGFFLKKRFLRIVIPFLFWSLIYITYHLGQDIYHGEMKSLSQAIDLILTELSQGADYHLWYIYMIIGIYLFIPVIGKWVRASTEKEILYFLVIWLITTFLNLPIPMKYKPDFNLVYFTGYIGYPILGYYLSKKEFIT
ncbi:MAG: acyltransferase family protein [Bacteroidales bacterium]|nr:acyltransferase family protein [Bacteroidales bacterium]